mmetsp:Transcript_66813/g.186689  ORF Transcript_66813/g.186689 Transcript_66813/m.186689 type:complete len:208 (-) Transcript_66813:576-1199(-)
MGSSSKGSSSATVAPRCCARTAYQKSRPHFAMSVFRSLQKWIATSAKSFSAPEGAAAMLDFAASAASASTSRVKAPPSSPTTRPKIAVRWASALPGGIHFSRYGSARGSNRLLAATTACTTSMIAVLACGVVSLVRACTSLTTSAQLCAKSREQVDSAKSCAACLTRGWSCTMPVRTTSAQNSPAAPPAVLVAARFWPRSAGSACWR